MIACVAISPALDITYRLSELSTGDVNRVTSVAERAGGKGVNVAAVARRLGAPVELIVPLGGATGDAVRAGAEADGIPTRVVDTHTATRRTVTIATDEGHPTGVYEPAAALTAQEWRALADLALAAAGPENILVISGSVPPGVGESELGELVDGARRRRGKVVVDTSGPALLTVALAGATAVKPNVSELEEATGESDWRRGAWRLIEAGVGLVLVSFGADGLVACAPRRILRAVGVPRLVGNPTGAGDAVVAALAAGLLAGRDPTQIVRACAATGAAAVLRATAGDVDRSDIDRLVVGVEIKEEPWGW